MSTFETNRFDGNFLERYRKGLLTPAEAHALEKAALDDPLLADALEGYMQAERDTESERTYLRTWINDRVEENQAAIRYIPRANNFQPFLRVAAVFLVLIGAAWMGYILWLEPKSPVLANRGPEKTNQTSSAQTQPAIQSSPLSDDPKTPIGSVPPAPATAEKPTEPPIAKLESAEAKLRTQADEAVSAAPVLQVTPPANQDADRSVIESVRPEETDGRREQVTESRTANAKATKPLIQEEPAPVNGWASFEEYLNQSRQVSPTPDNRNVSYSIVLLSFQVSEDGRPRDIRVERSGGAQNDKKAIDILLKGPDWKAGKPDQRGKVQIRF